ncbi:hypothetical protein ACFYYR_25610 [Streptomyces sp. NPDC001922]|uniref:hypothetical protein n=1 Tax=Streptomyces sp. NPDC001922 TaxID=3364624 RepID=UPI0036CF3627
MRRPVRAWGAAAVTALLAPLLTAVPAQARETERAAGTCRPALRILGTLPGTAGSDADRVEGLGPGSTAVGTSRGLPVYWTGTRVHRVPLPAGYTGGEVEAVNSGGLMVGSLRKPGGSAAFSYRAGARSVTLLPGGSRATDVNDHGLIVGEGPKAGALTGVEWTGTRVLRRLTLPAGYTLTEVTGINEAGRIVGSGEAVAGDESWTAGLLWPARGNAPAVPLKPYWPAGVPYDFWSPEDIDNSGRIVGTHDYSRLDIQSPVHWLPPYGSEIRPGLLAGRTSGTFEAVSPTTNVSVGTAQDSSFDGPFPPESAPPVQAQIWPGSGPLLALPRLAPDGASEAYAVSDDGRAGGRAADAHGTSRPVIWTCALAQAYQP